MKDRKQYRGNDVPIVSVIIPVYNAEEYLKQMLETVVKQTLQNIEIICVNDGSTDRSGEIIEKFRKHDKRISVLEQPNVNAGVARNRGLEAARGRYVVFWDADDRFERHALEKMYEKSEKTKADICVCGVYEFTDEGKVYEADGYLKMEMLPEKDPFNKYDISGRLFDFASNMVWNKMYRREFLEKNNLKFQTIRQSNDTAFVMLSVFLADAITCVDKRLASYRVNSKDSLTKKSSQTVFCPYEAYLYTLQKIKEYPEFSLVRKSFQNKTAKGMFRALNIQTSFEAYVNLFDFLQKEGLEKLGIHQCRKEDMEEEWIFNDLERIKTMSAGDFLLYKTNERKWDRDQLKYTLKRVRRRLSLLFSVNQKLKNLKKFIK